jgi:hypothetical protein
MPGFIPDLEKGEGSRGPPATERDLGRCGTFHFLWLPKAVKESLFLRKKESSVLVEGAVP